MRYHPDQLKELALKAIKRHKLVFIEEIVEHLPICKATFYNLGLDGIDEIRDGLSMNAINQKRKMRRNWMNETKNAALQLSLYKLLANDDELNRLSLNTHQHKIKDHKDKPFYPDPIRIEEVKPKQLTQSVQHTISTPDADKQAEYIDSEDINTDQ